MNDQVIAMLKEGKIGVIPTDTIYGVVASAQNATAVGRLYDLKHREGKPGTIIAASIEQLVELGFSRQDLDAAQRFWPGAVSVIVPTDQEYLHLGKQSVAVRIPGSVPRFDLLQVSGEIGAILKLTGPLLTSSANHPGEAPATTIAEARAYFNDQVDFYVDGGVIPNDRASKIVRIVDGQIKVLRP